MRTKFVLLVGDDEKQMFEYHDKKLAEHRDLLLNFEQSPSVATIFEVFADDLKSVVEDARSKGMKAGVYSSLEKAKGFMFKVMNVTGDDTIDLDLMSSAWGR